MYLRTDLLPLEQLSLAAKPGLEITPTVRGGDHLRKKKSTGKAKRSSTGRAKRGAKEKAAGKAKKKAEGAAEKSAEEEVDWTKNPADILKARANIAILVTESASAIATGVIMVAKAGQLASAKYLFEMAGVYPITTEAAAEAPEDSLAHTLLRRLGLPTEPVICAEDQAGTAFASTTKAGAQKPGRTAGEDLGSEVIQDASGEGIVEREPRKGEKDTVE